MELLFAFLVYHFGTDSVFLYRSLCQTCAIRVTDEGVSRTCFFSSGRLCQSEVTPAADFPDSWTNNPNAVKPLGGGLMTGVRGEYHLVWHLTRPREHHVRTLCFLLLRFRLFSQLFVFLHKALPLQGGCRLFPLQLGFVLSS